MKPELDEPKKLESNTPNKATISLGAWLAANPVARREGAGGRYLETAFRFWARQTQPYLQQNSKWETAWKEFKTRPVQ